jgi:hypothetical protein
MNYLVVICNITFGRLSHLNSADINLAGNTVQRRQAQVEGWFVIVYSEPRRRDNLVSNYLNVIIKDILSHSQQQNVQVDQVRVYFHFSNIFPDHDAQCDCGAGTIHQTRYQEYEEQIRRATQARGEIQVRGFHRTGEIWEVLNKLPEWLSGGGTLFSNPRPRSFSEFIKELDKASHEEIVRFASILKHRIAHLFTPVDIDLQGLLASNFRPDYWGEVVAAYRETKPTRVINEARRIKEELLGVVNEDQKKVIEIRWGEAEKALAKMVPLLCALETGKLDWCKEESENFRKAFRELLRILDELDDELAKSSPETK